jgi:hypothetical protein
MNYDDWLALSEGDRDTMHSRWDAYSRENVWIPLMAAARLAMMSSIPVLDATVGTYHGGEYILHMTVRHCDIAKCPQSLGQTFEGFRVAWLSEPEPPGDVREHPLIGRWRSAGDSGDYEIDIQAEDGALVIKCRTPANDTTLPIDYPPSHTKDSLQFYTVCDGIEQRHDLSCEADAPGRVRHEIATYQFACPVDGK